MIQRLFLAFLAVLLMGCNSNNVETSLENMDGYWEIEKAELPEGITKEFRYSEIVDFIEVENSKGFRKKVRPQLDGSFVTSKDRENFEIKVENDSINLYYTTPYNSWKETILSSKENQLVILNQRGIVYTYKRFTPYSLKDGQEN